MSKREIQIPVRVALVTKWLGHQPQHPPGVTRCEGDLEAIRARILESMDAVRPEIMILALLAIGYHRRAGGFELLDRLARSLFVQTVEGRIHAVTAGIDGFDQCQRAGNAPDGLGRDIHCRSSLTVKAGILAVWLNVRVELPGSLK